MSTTIAIGADHGGYPLKPIIKNWIETQGYTVMDCGTNGPEPVDYPDYAAAVGEAVASGAVERGIIICGSGVGASVAANKIPGVRAGLCHDTFSAHQGVEDDNMNVLCLGARVIGPNLALDVVRTWLDAKFSGAERHVRRLKKVHDIEQRYARTRSSP